MFSLPQMEFDLTSSIDLEFEPKFTKYFKANFSVPLSATNKFQVVIEITLSNFSHIQSLCS